MIDMDLLIKVVNVFLVAFGLSWFVVHCIVDGIPRSIFLWLLVVYGVYLLITLCYDLVRV